MEKINVLANVSYIGVTGINNHFRDFFRELSNHCNLRVRNFTVGATWNGLSNTPHETEPYLNDIDRKLLYKQTLWHHGKRVDYPVYNSKFDKPFDVNIVSDVVDHYYFYDRYDGLKIAYVVWESTILPPEFFDRLSYFDEIWVPSHWQKGCMVKQGIRESKIQVVPAGVVSETFFPEEVSFDKFYNNQKFKFLLFGRWDYRKATQEIIETFVKTFNKNEPVELIASVDNVLPKDTLKSTEERLKHYGLLDSRVRVVHFPSREDYIKFIKKGHVFVSCARSEGWNLPLIEAMAAGTPSIYSNCAAQLEYASGKGHPVDIVGEVPAKHYVGNYYEPDFKHLSKVMRDVYENYSAYKEKALRDSVEVRKNFCWKRVGEIGGEKLQVFYDSRKINLNKKKLKVLYVANHLSTGGAPQYLFKKIQLLNDECEVYCIEYNQIATWYVVQRNLIKELLKKRFFSLQDLPKTKILTLIKEIQPDVIHFEDFVETFISKDIITEIYKKERDYLIFESYHGLYFKPEEKIFFPDKFLFVSEYQAEFYKRFNVPYDIVEYPVEVQIPEKEKYKAELQFDPSYKHVIQVGLFAQWKNQAETVEYARALENEKIKFHFIGNQAPNFESYWKPLMDTLPSNCVVWGERSDVEKFYQAADLMIFPSKMETSPLVIREAVSWKLPSLIHRLPAYKDMYDEYSEVKYLILDDEEKNIELIKNGLQLI